MKRLMRFLGIPRTKVALPTLPHPAPPSPHAGPLPPRRCLVVLPHVTGPAAPAQHMREYLRAMDTDGSGKVEFDEFRLFMARMMCGEQGVRELDMAFEVRQREGGNSLARRAPRTPESLVCRLSLLM